MAAERIEVRVARPSDLPDVGAFGVTEIPAIYGSLFGAEEAARQLATWWSDSYLAPVLASGRMVGAFRAERMVGVAQLGRRADDHVLYKLYVAAELRGGGLGPQLIAAVDDLLPAAATRLMVEHPAANIRAAAFYEREGFTIESIESHPGGDSRRATVWRSRAR